MNICEPSQNQNFGVNGDPKRCFNPTPYSDKKR